jgi:Fe2+ or Zn2+ uptake regulation protein
LCTSCRLLKDVRAPGIGELAAELAEREGFDDIDVALTIVGLCSSCSALTAVQAGT